MTDDSLTDVEEPGMVHSGESQVRDQPSIGGEPMVMPEKMKKSIEDYRERFQQHQRQTCTQAVGDFDPATMIERYARMYICT